MRLIELEWNAALWRMPPLRALPDEQRVEVLENARAASRTAQHVFIGVVLVAVTALTSWVFASLFFTLPPVPSPLMLTPVPIMLVIRGWRDAKVRRSIDDQLSVIRRRAIDALIASHPADPATSPIRSS